MLPVSNNAGFAMNISGSFPAVRFTPPKAESLENEGFSMKLNADREACPHEN